MNPPLIGSRYRHYKSTGGSDHTYEVVGIAKHSETEELLVVYKPLYDAKDTRLGPCDYVVRPLAMRDEMVEREGKMVRRFTEMIDRVMPFGFVFDRDGRILLLHRIDRNTREPVKGGIELGETAEQAMMRELYEETSISIEEIDSYSLVGELISPIFLHGKEMNLHRVIYKMKLSTSQPPIIINHVKEGGCDHDQYRWCTIVELEDLDIDFKEAFMEALRVLLKGNI